jgi:hypothetical protein
MNTTKTLMGVLTMAAALGATALSPASANWFSNPRANTSMNVGSAPSPTPEQLRAIGDSDYTPYSYRDRFESRDDFGARSSPLEGRTVFGANGERLGYILAADSATGDVELQTPGGIGVVMPASLLNDEGPRVIAPTISRADVMDMARAQTGRTVALDVTGARAARS